LGIDLIEARAPEFSNRTSIDRPDGNGITIETPTPSVKSSAAGEERRGGGQCVARGDWVAFSLGVGLGLGVGIDPPRGAHARSLVAEAHGVVFDSDPDTDPDRSV